MHNQASACPACGQESWVSTHQTPSGASCPECGRGLPAWGEGNRFPGAQASDRFQFSLRKLLGGMTVACVLLVLFSLLLPAQRSANESARRNWCISNLKNIALALHNHHDIHNRFPLASSEPRAGRPGSADPQHPAGYGWHVALLPFLEEVALWDELVQASNDFQLPPFDPANDPQPATVRVAVLRCSSDGGFVDVDPGKSEYRSIQVMNETRMPARSNYVALAASHFANDRGLGDLMDATFPHEFDGNGVIPFPTAPAIPHQGLRILHITDGTSKTIVLAESREPAYSAWIDGQATWVIGAWQGASRVPTESEMTDGFVGWSDKDLKSRVSLGLDPDRNAREVYLSAARYGARHARQWGPSSSHRAGTVNHAFADGHVMPIMPSIDRNVYLRIISRSGGEPVNWDGW